MGRLAVIFLTSVLATPAQVAVSDAVGRLLHVAVDIPAKNHQLWPGVLTLTANEVRFETDQRGSDELLFSIPVKDVEEVEVAGFRERFLSLKVRQNSDFVKAYAFLLADNRSLGSNPLTVNFALGAKEDLRSGMATVNDFKSHLVHAPAIATSRMAGQTSETTERSATAPGPGAERRASDLFRQEARYLEKLKGFSALIVNNLSGTAGELVFFDDGFGYRSERQNPRISGAKSQFLEGRSLKESSEKGEIYAYHRQRSLVGERNDLFICGEQSGSPDHQGTGLLLDRGFPDSGIILRVRDCGWLGFRAVR